MPDLLARVAIIVTPREPFLKWIRNDLGGKEPFAADEEDERRTIYLLPPFTVTADTFPFVRTHSEEIFALELSQWNEDKRRWPKDRSYSMLTEWFEIEVTSMVWDLAKEPLRYL